MAIEKLNPYLIFNGTAEQAIRLYEKALGARTEDPMRFGDAPGGTVPPEHKNRVMHATLQVGGSVIMISDERPDHPVPSGANVQVCLHFSDPDEMARRFAALAEGGQVTMALHDTFWGAKFGTLTDAFGVRWMFNCDLKERA